jgi:hypothetical protein
MSTIYDSSSQPDGVRALTLVPGPQPWYATVPRSADERREKLADEHTRMPHPSGRRSPARRAVPARRRARRAACAHGVSELALRERAEGGAELVDAFEERALAIAASAARRTPGGPTRPPTARSRGSCAPAMARRPFRRSRGGGCRLARQLIPQGLAASSVAQRVCAVRRLAAAVGADPLIAGVRCTQIQRLSRRRWSTSPSRAVYRRRS